MFRRSGASISAVTRNQEGPDWRVARMRESARYSCNKKGVVRNREEICSRQDATMQKIVLYEEDSLMRDLLREWLSEAGYPVRVANLRDVKSNGEADLVIASIYMPKFAGAQVVRNIRIAYPHTPILAISGQFRAGLRQAGATAQALGVQQVLAKPLVRSEFLESVRAMIGAAG